MFINRRLDNENVVHIQNGILFGHNGKRNQKFAWQWMDLESIVLSKAIQTQRAECVPS